MNRNQAKKKLKQYLFYTLFVFIGLPLLTWFIIKVLGDGDGIEVLLQGLWGAFGLFWIVDTFRSFTAISIYLTSNKKSDISTKKESSPNFLSHFLNYINQRKKNISLFILAAFAIISLVYFYPLLSGKKIKQSGNSKQIVEHREKYEEEPSETSSNPETANDSFSLISDAREYYFSGSSKYEELKDYYGAIADLNKSLDLGFKYKEWIYLYRGDAKYELKDYYGAIADYTKVIEIVNDEAPELSPSRGWDFIIKKGSSPLYAKRAFSKIELKDYYGAIEDFTKAIELEPTAARYQNRAACKYELKDYYGAIADSNKAIELNPDNSDAYFTRAYSKANINDKNGACKDARKAQSLGNIGDLFTVIKYACN